MYREGPHGCLWRTSFAVRGRGRLEKAGTREAAAENAPLCCSPPYALEGQPSTYAASIACTKCLDLKPKCPIPAILAEGLAARVQSVQPSDLEELDPALPLSTYLTDPPDKSLLHIIVEHPPVHRDKRLKVGSPIHSLARILPRSADQRRSLWIKPKDVSDGSIAERIAEQQIGLETPSELSKSVYAVRGIQRNQKHRIFNDRPYPDLDIAPIALLYDGFGIFQDIYAGRTKEPVDHDISKMARFVKAVTAFCDKMSLFYDDGDQRRDAGLPLLDEIFQAYDGDAFQSNQPSAVGSVRTDGHSLCIVGGAADVVVQFKPEAGIAGVAEFLGLSYIARLHRVATARNMDLYERWRAPTLMITVAGAFLSTDSLSV